MRFEAHCTLRVVSAFAGTTGMYASPRYRVVLKLACFMPDCGPTMYSQQKNMGGNHDKSTKFARPSPSRAGGFDRRKLFKGRGGAGRKRPVTMKAASAATVAPLGQTGAPTLQTTAALGTAARGPVSGILAWSP